MTVLAASTGGVFIAVDGPSGVGKSTLTRALTIRLAEDGRAVHRTAEPSEGPIGSLARALTNTADGLTLACLYAADRYHHLATEIGPKLLAGAVVITDRYVSSGLVMQRLDGVGLDYLTLLNRHARMPDLLIALSADDDVIRRRLNRRGTHNRYQDQAGSSGLEATHHREASELLQASGVTVHRIDTTSLTAPAVADVAHRAVRELLATREEHAA